VSALFCIPKLLEESAEKVVILQLFLFTSSRSSYNGTQWLQWLLWSQKRAIESFPESLKFVSHSII
jgi:hypothetical protein